MFFQPFVPINRGTKSLLLSLGPSSFPGQGPVYIRNIPRSEVQSAAPTPHFSGGRNLVGPVRVVRESLRSWGFFQGGTRSLLKSLNLWDVPRQGLSRCPFFVFTHSGSVPCRLNKGML